MKKHSLFKVMLIILGLLVICSYIIPGREGSLSYIALGDIGLNFAQSFYYFFDTVVYLIVLGAFYGILNSIPAYKKLLDGITSKVRSHSKLFVFLTTGVFAVLTSITGLMNTILIFVPFVISIIMLLGYDKLVAVSATIVAMLVGYAGGIFVTFRDPSSYYGYASTTLEQMAGLDTYTCLLVKIILLVLGVAFLILYINWHIKNVQNKKVKYELNESSEVMVSEVKGDYKNIKTWPLLVVLSLILVILVLGYMPWNSLFGIECFDKFHEWLIGLTIPKFSVFGIKFPEYPVFNSLISGNLYALGNWGSLGSYMSIIITLIVFSIILKIIYRVKFNDVIDSFVEGSKKMIPSILLMMFAYAILVCSYNNGIMSTIINWLAGTKLGLNAAATVLVSALGTLLHPDFYYAVAGVFNPILTAATDESMTSTYVVAFQSVYGLVSVIAPTSFLLIVMLKYFDIPYTTWIKYIWRFVLVLLSIIILSLIVLSLI